MKKIEATLLESEKLAERGDPYGAWEAVEFVRRDFPHDAEISNRRAGLSARVADLASALSKADEMEARKQTGSSLAWFLKARKIYPQSRFAKDGIERLSGGDGAVRRRSAHAERTALSAACGRAVDQLRIRVGLGGSGWWVAQDASSRRKTAALPALTSRWLAPRARPA